VFVTVAVTVAVVAGLRVLGSPEDERRRKLDDVRQSDLMALRGAVAEHFDRTGRLPRSLEALETRDDREVALADPGGAPPYEYEVLGDSTFRLCATFDYETEVDEARFAYDPWAHRAGRQCYRFRIGRVGMERRNLVPVAEQETGP
jgi:hypothetical protein